jgi:hypothetical protein
LNGAGNPGGPWTDAERHKKMFKYPEPVANGIVGQLQVMRQRGNGDRAFDFRGQQVEERLHAANRADLRQIPDVFSDQLLPVGV